MKILKTLSAINENPNLSQRQMSTIVDVSLGKMNTIIKECVEKDLILKIENNTTKKYEITETGFKLLEKKVNEHKNYKVSISRNSSKKINTAVILAAGKRKDLDISPSRLILNSSTVIEETIKKLQLKGLTNIIIVLGYESEEIKSLLSNYSNLTFVESVDYYKYGSMNSLFLVKPYIKDDFILVEGDLLFEVRALDELLKSTKRESILITDKSGSGNEELVQTEHDNLYKLTKDIRQLNRVNGEFVGISKISSTLYKLMLNKYKGTTNPLLNYEYVLLDVSRNFNIPVLYVKDLVWKQFYNKYQYEKEL